MFDQHVFPPGGLKRCLQCPSAVHLAEPQAIQMVSRGQTLWCLPGHVLIIYFQSDWSHSWSGAADLTPVHLRPVGLVHCHSYPWLGTTSQVLLKGVVQACGSLASAKALWNSAGLDTGYHPDKTDLRRLTAPLLFSVGLMCVIGQGRGLWVLILYQMDGFIMV